MKQIFTLILLSLAVFSASAADSAASLLAKCASAVGQAPALKVSFYYTVSGQRMDCEMTMAKQRFVIDAGRALVWFDGTTQWSFDEKNKSVSITEPTEDELMETNPFVILNHYSKNYDCRLLQAEGGLKRVELAAKSRHATVRKAVISINPATNFPEKILVTLSNGRVVALVVSKIEKIKAVTNSTFIYNPQKYPASETIDLR